ncbi:response regulator transcription factor [Bifidobacterium choloepi]|uniref:Response regulator transcription factor n=1 Tax=Bifidobacterium choloepi TaxID=2614131 RepID=A0A6I5N1S9_9BIFI|nr:response regulator transcription factor [Bifidobacterium choloepi]NEG70115.1 response regulator transcription factor [Bifidobacterium choloepi]
MTLTVAIADDDPIVCSSIRTILETTATADVVWTANDGADAVAKYGRIAPDVLLLDVQMPGMDGLTAAGAILGTHPDAKILVLTTFADADYIARAVQLGTRGYLIKQDVASVIPAVQSVAAGQIVLGSEILDKITGGVGRERNNDASRVRLGGAGKKAESCTPDSVRGKANADAREPRGADGNGDTSGGERFAFLTPREHDIAELVAEGLDNRSIAMKLNLSEGTVRNRLSGILAKTNLKTRTQLALEWNVYM